MRKKIAYSSLFLLTSLLAYISLFFVYGDIKLRNLEFAGETVPETEYSSVERLIVENNKKFLKRLYVKNAESRFMPEIEKKISDNGLPYDLKYIPIVESSLNPHAVSRKGAYGIWQLMPETAEIYGMKVGGDKDQRKDIDLSTNVALEHLVNLHDVFGNWTLSVAAYNRGETGVQNDIARAGTNDYYKIDFNKETGEYVYKILAYKYAR